jgi:hypothetical protein
MSKKFKNRPKYFSRGKSEAENLHFYRIKEARSINDMSLLAGNFAGAVASRGNAPGLGPRMQVPRVDFSSKQSTGINSGIDFLGSGLNECLRGDLTGDCAVTVDLEDMHYCIWREKENDFSLSRFNAGLDSYTNFTIPDKAKDDNMGISNLYRYAATSCTSKGKEIATPKHSAQNRVSIVVPDICDQQYILAASSGISSSGNCLANVFRRGSSVIAGILSRAVDHAESKSNIDVSKLLLALGLEGNPAEFTNSKDLHVKIIYIDICKRNEHSDTHLYASVVSCEQSRTAIQNKYGFGRISTIADSVYKLSSPSDIASSVTVLLNRLETMPQFSWVRTVCDLCVFYVFYLE